MPAAGRFAPSPTGPLHLGSLTTALASWLDARANGQRWYVRMEDIDAPREEAGASEHILHQLRCHGLVWDDWTEGSDRGDGVLYQHTRQSAYRRGLIDLIAQGLAYPCTCSRKRLLSAIETGVTRYNPDGEILYPGYCRSERHDGQDDAESHFEEHAHTGVAWRFRNLNGDDFVLRRADGFWAYNFAVVMDDAFQGITRIVRGDDLFHAAPRHSALRQCLGLPEPTLLHVPVIRNEAGEKLSKQTQAPPLRVDNSDTIRMQLECAWSHLELTMPMGWIVRVRPMWHRFYRGLFHRVAGY